jgi:hypothetical protein
MEPLEPVWEVVEEGAFGLDQVGKRVAQPLCVIAGVGVRAFGEEDLDLLPGSLPLARGGEGRRRDLVGREAGDGRPAEHLGDDPRERLRATPLRRPIRDMRPGPVSTRDVARIRQASIDRPDRVGVYSECGTELPDRSEASAWQQPAGVDLVGKLPEDLGRDRDVGVARDVQIAARAGVSCGVLREGRWAY